MAKVRGKVVRALAVAFVLAGLCAEAAASCWVDSSPACQLFWRADVVFVGTVVEVTHTGKYRKADDKEQWDRRDRIARFHVEEVFRGEAGQDLKITATEILPTEVKLPDGSTGSKHISTSDCEQKFKPGERYVVYANSDPERPGRLRVSLGRARAFAQAAEDLAFLRGVKTAPPTARVYGAVLRHNRDLKDGDYVAPTPVEGVRIEVATVDDVLVRTATTNQEGFYEVAGLAPDQYLVRPFMPEGLAPYVLKQPTRVEARGCARVDFYTRFDGRVAGRVTDAEGRPVKELRIDLIHAEGPPISLKGISARTDAEGRYELKEVPPGRYLLGFGLGGEPDASAPYPRTYYPGVAGPAEATAFEVAPGQRLSLLDLRLPPRLAERAVEVVVVWPDGQPVSDAMLRLENEDYRWSATATRQERLDGAGRYRAYGFDGVTYWVHAHVNLKGGSQMHAEPIKFVLGEGAGPFRLVIASPYGNCPHYRRQR